MDKHISYLNRDFYDYKQALIEYSKKYYPDLFTNFSEASIENWLIELNANIADNLSYHIDRVFQETDIDSAQKEESIRAIARNNGVRVPGPKAAMSEVAFTCQLPIGKTEPNATVSNPDFRYAPLIKKGTLVRSSDQVFEVMEDVDFSQQFNSHGITDRTIRPVRDSNRNILRYEVTKLAIVMAGETKVFTKYVESNEVKPFMEINLPNENILSVESVITKEGGSFTVLPKSGEFFVEEETPKDKKGLTRFFEVDYLAQQSRWGTSTYEGIPIKKEYSYLTPDGTAKAYSICKGEWLPVKHKYITEPQKNGGMKIIFGSGMDVNNEGISLDGASDFAKYQITKMLRNDNLGILPKANTTLYILYRTGGGQSSNVPKGAINNIMYLDADIPNSGDLDSTILSAVKNTISVENVIPSISGKDAPTTEEIKNIIKYHNGANGRCVTIKDYKSRIMEMPPEYGSPYRIGIIEENNKIMVYLLGIDYAGNISAEIPDALIRNISEYLTNYKMINDLVEMKVGRIVNLSLEVTLHINKDYNPSEVKKAVADVIRDYMDTSKREMGDNIYIGGLINEVSKVDGVINWSNIDVYNEVGPGYSNTQISQTVYDKETEEMRYKVNLDESENILYCDGDTMLEIKNPNLGGDIKIITKSV